MHPFFLKDDVIVYDVLKPGAVKKHDTHFGSLYVDLDKGNVQFIQRWKYRFVRQEVFHPHQTASAWTNQEELDFHQAATSLIWKFWDSSPKLAYGTDPSLDGIVDLLNADRSTLSIKATGTSAFAKKFIGQPLEIRFDVSVSVSRPHYTVIVKKMLSGKKMRSFVDYATRTIHLTQTDTEPTSVQQDGHHPSTSDDFIVLTHEFGHAIGYGTDEYEVGAAKRADVHSLMNIGREVRSRHFRFIIHELGQMFPHTHFEIA